MGYTIELSYDVRKHGNISTVKNMIIDIAEKYDYDMIYNFMETESTAAWLSDFYVENAST